MKVTVITGSAHKKGTSALLADEFIRGVQENGHEVFRFDAAFANVKGCLGCDYCRNTGEPCVLKDDMATLTPYLLEADAIAFASPVYYFGFSAQLKAVLDRFYAPENKLMGHKKSVLLVTAGSPEAAITKNVTSLYHDVIDWMKWENAGEVLAFGSYSRADIEQSRYPEQAHMLGRKLFTEN